ncbi:hypothetical protein F511_33740 [Dorcoceras hygrometricum]|uniref:Dystroglycan-like n=1 Tax=Dorcoceras hygrometricum TaxID=472368 RepID=A0A2Z7DCG8_9LAMI|nr:hypothetical protein F511_33740 [Dorcoceras hygrometricum]
MKSNNNKRFSRKHDRKVLVAEQQKRFSRKHDRKVLVAEESTKSWADSDSDESSSSSSSSESEQEEVHCLMADQTDEDEVFDFPNVEFTRVDLVIALNDMVKEYRKLTHSFEEAKAENISLKSCSDEQEDADTLTTELKLSSWNKANITLQKICENQKQASDKTGIGFSDSEFYKGESSTQSRPAYDKFNKMGFVKADMIYDCFESVKYDNQNSPMLNENGKAALMASGLRGFLGCPAVVYEDALVDLFENASVRNGVVFSTVGGQIVKISEKLFAESFELPVEGLEELSEMPKDSIFDARSIVLLTGEQINLSGKKNQMKMPYRLLCDIVAKAISVKAGSFNAITVEKFSLMTAVVCGVKMNWAKYLFGILKKMFAAKTKQAKGFAIQISALLATFPSVEFGEASEFPASKVLTKKTVLRFISINKDGAEEVSGAATKKVVSKKRTADDIEVAVPKKKRTSKKKSISSISSVEMLAVAEEAVPIQQVAESLNVEESRCSSADVVDVIIQQVLDETRAEAPADTAHIEQPAVTVEKNWFDLPYEDIVKQWEAENPVVTASDTEDEDLATEDVAPADQVQQEEEVVAPISVEVELSVDETMSLDDILLSIPVDIPLPSTCMEVTQIKMGHMIKIPGVTEKTWFLQSLPQIPAADKGKEVLVDKDPIQGNPAEEHFSLICADIDQRDRERRRREAKSLQIVESASSFAPSSSSVFALRFSPFCSVFVDMSLLNRISSADITEFLSSIALDKTVLRSFQKSEDYFSVAPRVQLALAQQQSSSSSSSSSSSLRFDATDIDATATSQPHISPDLSAMIADFQVHLSEKLFESQSNISSKLHKIEQNVRDSLIDQAAVFKSLSQEARQETRLLDDVQTIRFNEFRKHVLEQNASIFIGLADVHKEVDAIHAKVDIMASRLNDIQKEAEATKEAHSHQFLEFQSQAQENHTVIHAQLSELVDYIHRGRADKKGEISGSRGPQQPAGTQITGSAVTPSFEQRVQIAQRRLVQTVINADAADRERQEAAEREAAERDRERRRREAKSLKRRRKD